MVAIQNRLKAQKNRRAASSSGNKCDATENRVFLFCFVFTALLAALLSLVIQSVVSHTGFIVLRFRNVALRPQKP